MRWTLIQLSGFATLWKSQKLTDEDLQSLESAIMRDPASAPVMKGTGGLRKARFAPLSRGKGKSGSLRIGYAQFPDHKLVLLVTMFLKSSQENLGADERNQIKAVLDVIAEKLKNGERI
ncbi:MAG: hypothetical protein JWL69_703 [Phycisphaerales bacterium]|jgi:hypothetical protein|nr:hypothetical protein [Phycisphaerales bacterium]MDB5356226.1 hypothetical protein [Phycisphaerales bacterium]